MAFFGVRSESRVEGMKVYRDLEYFRFTGQRSGIVEEKTERRLATMQPKEAIAI